MLALINDATILELVKIVVSSVQICILAYIAAMVSKRSLPPDK